MQKYFAAANSASGFVSRFDDIFDPAKLNRTYIIKGGCGTGKSTLMKKAAERAEAKGASVEYYYCSSDPDSLDGVIMSFADGRKYAIIDGTAPHIKDPVLPGAIDEIINVGEYLCEDILTAERSTVMKLARRKGRFYKDAYRSLASAGVLYRSLVNDIGGAVLYEKLDRASERLISARMRECKIKEGEGDYRELTLSAISSKGQVYFDSFSNSSAVYEVSDVNESFVYLYDSIIAVAKSHGLSVWRAFMPLIPEYSEAVMLPELSLSIVSRTERRDTAVINMARFIDKESLAMMDRHRRRVIKKALRELMVDAEDKLSLASRAHGELERIYSGAMDFTRLSEASQKLFSRMGI